MLTKCNHYRIDHIPGEFFFFFFAVVRLVLRLWPSFLLGGATAAAPKSEAAVDGNRKEVADRVASLHARLGNRELENYAACASPL